MCLLIFSLGFSEIYLILRIIDWDIIYIYVYIYHVPEGLGVFPVPWSSRWSWPLHLFLGRPMFLRPFGLYCSACFGSLFVSILCTCCSHFFWYCFISFTMFCAPVFCLIHWFFFLSSFVIPSKCLKNFIFAASKRCSSLFFSTQASLPYFNAALAVMLWIIYIYIGPHVKYPLFLSDFKELNFLDRFFKKIFRYRFPRKSLQWKPSCSMWSDGRTDRQGETDLFFPQFCFHTYK